MPGNAIHSLNKNPCMNKTDIENWSFPVSFFFFCFFFILKKPAAKLTMHSEAKHRLWTVIVSFGLFVLFDARIMSDV